MSEEKEYEPPKQTVTLEWWPTPKELAEVFMGEMSDYQAEFFNEIARIAEEWKKHPTYSFPMQLQYIVDQTELQSDQLILSPEGKAIMSKIGEYGDA